jgi:hypothetical protein
MRINKCNKHSFEMASLMGQYAHVQVEAAVLYRSERPQLGVPPESLLGGTFVCIDNYISLMHACWADDLHARPSFSQIIPELRRMLKHVEDRGTKNPVTAVTQQVVEPQATITFKKEASRTARQCMLTPDENSLRPFGGMYFSKCRSF